MTPKQLFLQDKPRVVAHNAMVQSPLFRSDADVALLQMQENLLGSNATGDKALSNYHMMAGARIFLQVFMGLGRESTVDEPKGLPPNLNH